VSTLTKTWNKVVLACQQRLEQEARRLQCKRIATHANRWCSLVALFSSLPHNWPQTKPYNTLVLQKTALQQHDTALTCVTARTNKRHISTAHLQVQHVVVSLPRHVLHVARKQPRQPAQLAVAVAPTGAARCLDAVCCDGGAGGLEAAGERVQLRQVAKLALVTVRLKPACTEAAEVAE
jgi:hypothetical protein